MPVCREYKRAIFIQTQGSNISYLFVKFTAETCNEYIFLEILDMEVKGENGIGSLLSARITFFETCNKIKFYLTHDSFMTLYKATVSATFQSHFECPVSDSPTKSASTMPPTYIYSALQDLVLLIGIGI